MSPVLLPTRVEAPAHWAALAFCWGASKQESRSASTYQVTLREGWHLSSAGDEVLDEHNRVRALIVNESGGPVLVPLSRYAVLLDETDEDGTRYLAVDRTKEKPLFASSWVPHPATTQDEKARNKVLGRNKTDAAQVLERISPNWSRWYDWGATKWVEPPATPPAQEVRRRPNW